MSVREGGVSPGLAEFRLPRSEFAGPGARCRDPLRGCPPATPAEPVDALLVRRAREGDRAAREALVQRYQDRIYTIAYNYLRDPEEALDVTQEALIRIIEQLPRFRERARFSTWVYRIVVNRCIDRGRKKARRPACASLRDLEGDGTMLLAERRVSLCPQAALENRELRDQLEAAIAALPEPFRIVAILADVEGVPPAEIARVLRCPAITVRTRLHRARGLLRERLKQYVTGTEQGCA